MSELAELAQLAETFDALVVVEEFGRFQFALLLFQSLFQLLHFVQEREWPLVHNWYV